ncbi:lytic murein transglycosylase [uncultured Roseobacter sp.]|uniref:lytic murein transglycosylase n=1 Tax=uncultured Roseobacter sp. TaxID=114847 RepID=UPI00261C4DC7|nr:lytic murein transglycosylase [uncultured Roseobacter sp.]
MSVSRRWVVQALGACALGACGNAPVGGSSVSGLPADLRPQPNAAYDAWVQVFRQRALRRGVSQDTLARGFRGTGYLPGVVTRDRNQPETRRTLEDYLSIAVSDERVALGREALRQNAALLARIEARYGVPAPVVTAIWGLESFYGARRGDVPVVSATSTLAFDGRRGAFFEEQLTTALKILQAGEVSADRLRGSWAGAMGHTQFIPTSYTAFAVDFDGDGRRDVWSDDPTDALASAAAYLSRNGWRRGLSWGREGTSGGRVIQPQAGGPRFAVTANFAVIKRYNNSDSYAIGVGHLADRIAGGGPLRGGFPPDAYGLTKEDRIALQRGLTARGFDTGGADGVIGSKTRAAITAYQRQAGLAPTGDPSLGLLTQVRG